MWQNRVKKWPTNFNVPKAPLVCCWFFETETPCVPRPNKIIIDIASNKNFKFLNIFLYDGDNDDYDTEEVENNNNNNNKDIIRI